MQQLELFRTPEQQERLENAIETFKRRQEQCKNEFYTVLQIIVENGFVEGKHYEIEGNVEFIKKSEVFNYGRYNESLEEEVEVEFWDGDIKFIWQQYCNYDKELKVRKTRVCCIDGKFNIHELQRESRYVKASTLKDKLDFSWVSSQNQYNRILKQDNAVTNAIKKLQTDFPNAKVRKYGGYEGDKTIIITFPNGNYCVYDVWSNGDLSHKKTYVATIMNLDGNDRLKMLENL